MPATGNRKILIVEDQKIVALDLQHTLEDLDWVVIGTAGSADEAVACCTRECPDLVLMDIHIKGTRDGIETAALLAERFGVGHLFLTAYSSEATIAKAKATGPLGYLIKPVSTRDLKNALDSALARHQIARAERAGERWTAPTEPDSGAPSPSVILVDDSSRVLAMNAAARTLTRWDEEEAEERTIEDLLLAVEDPIRSGVGEAAARLLLEGCAVHRSDGVTLLYPVACMDRIARGSAPIVDESGNPLGTIVTTHGGKDERRLRRQVQETDRLAALGSMAGGIAHDLQNPLAYVISNVEFAFEEVADCAKALRADGADTGAMRRLSEVVEALAEARTGIRRVADIAADLKGLAAGKASNNPRPVSLSRLLRWVTGSCSPEVVRRARLVTEFADAPEVLGDDVKLGRVFTNLIRNAAQAIEPGEADRNEVRISARAAGDRALIQIADTGAGMTPEVQARVFEPFFTTKGSSGGTGMGLAICRGIIRSAGGEITLESAPGEGTVFTISLPRVMPASAQPMPAAAPGRVLVVHPEQIVRTALRRTLTSHQLSLAASVSEAVTLVEQGQRFDLLFCGPDRAASDELRRGLFGCDAEQSARVVTLADEAPEEGERPSLPGAAIGPLDPSVVRDTARRWLAANGHLRPASLASAP